MKRGELIPYAGDSGIIGLLRLHCRLLNLISISLNYCPLLRGKIRQGGVALNHTRQIMLNQAPCFDLFFRSTTRS